MQYCKRLLRVKTSTQNDFIYGELGRTDFYTKRVFMVIKYWLNVLEMGENKYARITYNLMLKDIENNNRVKNWASQVKSILESLGFPNAWLLQGVGNKTVFLSLLRQRLRDTFIQNWQSRLQNSSRAMFYKEFANFEYQTYLDLNKVKFRVALTKLRVSSHRLEIETGRWSRPKVDRQNRKCKVCNAGPVEDEFHFIFECSEYIEFRQSLIKPFYWRRPSMFKMIQLLQTENKKDMQKLAAFIFKSFNARTEKLFNN